MRPTLSQHVLNRLAFGPAPGNLAELAQKGPQAWFEEQLYPDRGAGLAPDVQATLDEWDTLRREPGSLFREFGPPALRAARAAGPEALRVARARANRVLLEATGARLVRAVCSRWQFQEVLTDFWFNHFNVWAGKGLCHWWVGAYERDAIRPHVLGRFEDLLLATAQHPAMLFYLDNWLSSAPGRPGARGRFAGFNENYGREVMELHTLGVEGGYQQADVDALALMLTGWTMRPLDGQFWFDEARHALQAQMLLGRRFGHAGESQGREALVYLAQHPNTARHIAAQLAQYFVADDPPPTLVERLTERWLETQGDLRSVYRTLVSAPEFLGPKFRGARFRTPYQFVVAATRASGQLLRNPAPLKFFLTRMGQPLYGCIQPNGYPVTADHWLNPDGVLLRLDFAVALGAGRLPVTHRPGTAHQPRPVALDALLDTLGPVSAKTVRAARRASRPFQAAVILGSPAQLYA